MPLINVENAQIKTAAVEVKTLTISGKQVTLSVFRQVKEEDLIDYENDFSFKGIPWGRVNYFWKDNGNEQNYFHVIWQLGKELRRCIIKKKFNNTFNEWDNYGDLILFKNDYKNIKQQLRIVDSYKYESCGESYFTKEYLPLRCIAIIEKKIKEISYYTCREEDKLKLKTLKENLMEAGKLLDIEKEKLEFMKNEYIKKMEKFIKFTDLFNDLPQLFIAV